LFERDIAMRSKVVAGGVAGLLAGLVFGVIMQVVTTPMPMSEGGRVPMMAMVAQLARSDSLAVGWIILLFNGVVMGGVFGYVLGGRVGSLGGGLAWGVLYGIFLWVLGGLILMPILLGMAAFSPLTMAPMRPGAMVSLAAHLLSGLILGAAFTGLYRRGPAASRPVPPGIR
jgi:tetrahydromethanopterin S-methyltransferase subunit F